MFFFRLKKAQNYVNNTYERREKNDVEGCDSWSKNDPRSRFSNRWRKIKVREKMEQN